MAGLPTEVGISDGFPFEAARFRGLTHGTFLLHGTARHGTEFMVKRVDPSDSPNTYGAHFHCGMAPLARGAALDKLVRCPLARTSSGPSYRARAASRGASYWKTQTAPLRRHSSRWSGPLLTV